MVCSVGGGDSGGKPWDLVPGAGMGVEDVFHPSRDHAHGIDGHGPVQHPSAFGVPVKLRHIIHSTWLEHESIGERAWILEARWSSQKASVRVGAIS